MILPQFWANNIFLKKSTYIIFKYSRSSILAQKSVKPYEEILRKKQTGHYWTHFDPFCHYFQYEMDLRSSPSRQLHVPS